MHPAKINEDKKNTKGADEKDDRRNYIASRKFAACLCVCFKRQGWSASVLTLRKSVTPYCAATAGVASVNAKLHEFSSISVSSSAKVSMRSCVASTRSMFSTFCRIAAAISWLWT